MGTKQQIRLREGLRVTHGRTARDRGERERARTRTDAMASESDPLRAVALEGRLGARSHNPLAREKNAVRLSFLTTPFPLPPLLSPRRLHAGRAVGHPRAPEAPGAAVRYAEGRRVRAFAAPRARRRAVVSQATAGARREAIEGQRRPEVVDRGGPRARRGEGAQESRLERLRRLFAVRPRARPPSRPRSVRALSKNNARFSHWERTVFPEGIFLYSVLLRARPRPFVAHFPRRTASSQVPRGRRVPRVA